MNLVRSSSSRAGAALLVVVLALGISACGSNLECTDAGCGDRVRIELTSPELAAGSYELHALADERDIVCVFSVPVDPSRPDPSPECGPGAVAFLSFSSPSSPGALDLLLAPHSLTVDVRRESVVILRGPSFEPHYETIHPNGPDCPPSCEFATRSISLE